MAAAVCFRIAVWDTPLRVLANGRPGRFNRAGEAPTQYLSLHPLAPWAEIARGEGLRRRTELDELRMPVWAARLSDNLDPVRIGFDEAELWGIQPEELVGDDHRPCQELAARIRADPAGPRELIVPSAALPGAENLVLLGPRVAVSYLLEPLSRREIPAARAAERSCAPPGLEGLVCHRGEEHRALESWRRGESFIFEEPVE